MTACVRSCPLDGTWAAPTCGIVARMDRPSWSVSRWSVVALIGLLLLAYGPPAVDWFGLMVLVAIGWAIFHNVRRLDRAADAWRTPKSQSSPPLPPPPRPD
jgi:hypothetical protein